MPIPNQQYGLADVQNQLSAATGGNVPAQPAQLTPGAQSDLANAAQGMSPMTNNGLAPANNWTGSDTNNRSTWGSNDFSNIMAQVDKLNASTKEGYVAANKVPKKASKEIQQGLSQTRVNKFQDYIQTGKMQESELQKAVDDGKLTREEANDIMTNLAYAAQQKALAQQKPKLPQSTGASPSQPGSMIPDVMNPTSPVGQSVLRANQLIK